MDTNSGTSFAAPYVSGVVALWLQHKQQQAAAARETLADDDINHDAAMRGLVATAKGVPDPNNKEFLEPVAWMGAGVLVLFDWTTACSTAVSTTALAHQTMNCWYIFSQILLNLKSSCFFACNLV